MSADLELAGAAYNYFAQPKLTLRAVSTETRLRGGSDLDLTVLGHEERLLRSQQLATYANEILKKYSHVLAVPSSYMYSAGKNQFREGDKRLRNSDVYNGVFFGRQTGPAELHPPYLDNPVHVALADNFFQFKFMAGATTSIFNILNLTSEVEGNEAYEAAVLDRTDPDLASLNIINDLRGSTSYAVSGNSRPDLTTRFEFDGMQALLEAIDDNQPAMHLGSTAVLPTLPVVFMHSSELTTAPSGPSMLYSVNDHNDMHSLRSQFASVVE